MFKIWFRFQISRICFLDNCSWIGCGKFFLLRREYFPSTVNVLTNTHRISEPLTLTFSNTIFAKVIKQYDGSAVVHFFRLFNMLTVPRYCERRLFKYLTNHIFRSLYFQKYITFENHTLFQIVQHVMQIPDIQQKIKKFFCFLDNWSWIGCGKFFLL